MTDHTGESVARLYAILERLHRARRGPNPEHWVVSTDRLRELSPRYSLDGTPTERSRARQLLQRDLRKLVERGLIQTGVVSAETPNAQGVRFRVQEKPDELHLTDAEHRALQGARRKLQPLLPLVTHEAGTSDLDIADSAITALMERQGWASGPALAEALRVPEARLRAVLEAVAYADRELVPLRIRADEDPWEVELTDQAISERGERGLGAIGRFAYTRLEVDERLAVIEQAVVDVRLPEHDRALLHNVRAKLLRWQTEYLERVRGDARRRGDAATRRGRLSGPRPGSDVSTD